MNNSESFVGCCIGGFHERLGFSSVDITIPCYDFVMTRLEREGTICVLSALPEYQIVSCRGL